MKIACIGNAVFDYICSSNYFIKEGVRNSFDNASFNIGGPALNAACVINKFGSKVDFYGRVGNDPNGTYIINELIKEKINIENISISNSVMTPTSFIHINTDGNTRTICSFRSKEDYNHPKININKYNTNYDYILTDGKYVYDTLKLIKNSPNAITIIDAGRVKDDIVYLCRFINYIICSEDFAYELTGIHINNEVNMKNSYLKLKEMFPLAKGIVITIGERGYIYEKDNEVLNNKAYIPNSPIIDTNGAGDIFHGAFTYAISNGYDYYNSLEFANITASLSTTKSGGKNSCPTLDQVVNILNSKNKKLIKKNHN